MGLVICVMKVCPLHRLTTYSNNITITSRNNNSITTKNL